jgi:hypothetical protein
MRYGRVGLSTGSANHISGTQLVMGARSSGACFDGPETLCILALISQWLFARLFTSAMLEECHDRETRREAEALLQLVRS